MENKNTLIAFGLILVIYTAYVLFFPPAPKEIPGGEDKKAASVVSVVTPEASIAEMKEELSLPSAVKGTPGDLKINPTERKITLENDLFRLVLNSAGGKIEKFELKNFKKEPHPGSENILLVDAADPSLGTLSTIGKGALGFPGDPLYDFAGLENQYLVSGNEETALIFRTVHNQLLLEKVYRFSGNKYAFFMDIRVTNQSGDTLNGSLDTLLVQPFDESMKGNRFTFVGAATLFDDKLETDSVEDIEKKPATYSGNVGWSGFEDKYFFKAVVPLDERKTDVLVQMENSVFLNQISEKPILALQPGASAQYGYLVYFGPRDLEILKSVGHRLEAVVDFGYFDIIARPLLSVLKFFYGFVGNYGWAIILLTVVIKILFWPLTDKSYGSMKAMQKIQPEMQKLRQKYKDDKQRLNIEIMQLYRTHKVNPLGGCLPMIIQIPVFFALYKVLMEDIALRHAPFMLWIQDLSAKDPYYITPIVMGVTMFIQQKLTPSTMDSTQAKILLYMPLIFTFMFLNFPSGLVIYWLVNNLLTILQQYLVNRKAA